MATLEDFKKLDLRVAEILEAQPHPDADRLYLLQIQVGEEKKQIVAGIRTAYEADGLKGKKIIVVNNLEPAVIRGQTSNGMLLAAKNDQTLSLVTIEKELPSGVRVG